MPVVVALLAPGGAGRVLATVFAPLDVRTLAEHVGLHEWADVWAHAIVQVRMPADGLLLQGLPPKEDVVWGFTFEDQLELVLELLRFDKAVVCATLLISHCVLLFFEPLTEVGVGEFFQE